MTREFKFKIDWLFWFIILLPTFFMVGKDMRHVQMNFFQIATMVLVAVIHVNKYIGLFLFWCVFQFVFFARSPEQGLDLQNLLYGALIYQFIVLYAQRENFKKYFWAFSGVLILSVLWSVRQYFQIDPILTNSESWNLSYFSEFPGIFHLPAFAGNYAAAVLPLTFAISWALFPFALIALFWGKSTFSAFAALISVLFFFWFRKRIVFWAILLIGGISFGSYAIKYDLPTGEFDRRIKCWRLVEAESFKKQFFGHGIGKFKDFHIFEMTPSHDFLATHNLDLMPGFVIDQVRKKGKHELAQKIIDTKIINEKELEENGLDFHKWREVHNEFLQAFYETGFVGLSLICLFIWDVFRRFFKFGTKNLAALSLISSFIAILIVSFGHFPFHLARLAGPFVVIMALLEVVLNDARRVKEATI